MAPKRLLVILLLVVLTAASPAVVSAQSATPDPDAALDGHLAWVLSLFDGGASELTEADVESRFTPTFLELVPAEEFIVTTQQLVESLGPLMPVEDRSTAPGEFVGLFRSASGEGVQIAFAVDPESGLIAGFFITPVDVPAAQATPGAVPSASPVASSTPAGVVVDDPEAQIALYQERVAAIRAVGEPAIEAMLAGDGAALGPYLSPDVSAALESQSVSDVLDSYTARQVQMSFAEVGAYFFGQWNGEEIVGAMVQGGQPVQFTLTAATEQDGDLPAGRWAGELATIGLAFEVAFGRDAQGNLTATLTVPQQGIEDVELADVAYLPERPIGEVVGERAFAPGGRNNSYTVDVAWGDHLLRVAVGVDVDSGLVNAVQIVPAVPLAATDDAPEPKASYRAPFAGTWWVFWGGETELRNYHAGTPSQRYAFDLVIWKDGATWTGDGARNEDYWAWGQPVLAPAGGTVVHAVNDAADLSPNSPAGMQAQARNPGGNHVVIQTGDAEYVIVAHMQQGSVRVGPGDEVETGDLLGLVGNSGNSSEPHIHIHVQDTPDLLDPDATGIPLRFASLLVDGEAREDVVPDQGSFIATPQAG